MTLLVVAEPANCPAEFVKLTTDAPVRLAPVSVAINGGSAEAGEIEYRTGAAVVVTGGFGSVELTIVKLNRLLSQPPLQLPVAILT